MPPVDRKGIKRALKKDLEELSRTHGLKTEGKKADLSARLLRYQDLRDVAASREPESESERAIARRGLLLFLLSLGVGRKGAEALASLFGSLRAFQQAAADDIDLLAGVSAAEAVRIREAIAHGETVPAPENVSLPESVSPPEDVEAPSRDLEPQEVVAPKVVREEGALLLEPPVAAQLETIFEPLPALSPSPEQGLQAEPGLQDQGPSESAAVEARATTAVASRLRRDRIFLYAGTALQALGGFGLVFGSLLHDAFRVPWLGQNFATFGSMNAAFAVGGVMLLMAGLGAIGFSLRGGVVQSPPATEG